MTVDIISEVIQAWEHLGFSFAAPLADSFVLHSRRSIILFLIDARKTSHPHAVIKVDRDAGRYEFIHAYVELSQIIRQSLPVDLRQAIPEMRTRVLATGLTAVVQQGMPGAPIQVSQYRNRPKMIIEHCRSFAEWLDRFHNSIAHDHMTVDIDYINRALKKAQMILDHLGLEKAHALLIALEGVRIPVGWSFGDAHPSNILFDDRCRVTGLVDWEGVSTGRPLFFDWFQFAISLAIEIQRSLDPRSSIAELNLRAVNMLLQDSSTFGSFFWEQTAAMLRGFQMPSQNIRAYFLLFLLMYYYSDFTKIMAKQLFSLC